jgi:predicted transcriptional regulator
MTHGCYENQCEMSDVDAARLLDEVLLCDLEPLEVVTLNFTYVWTGDIMKKLKNEVELVKKAILEGVKYGEGRGVVEFEATDSAAEKIEYIYRLLIHDKLIQPLPEDQVSQQSMRHKLAIWASKLK